MWRRRLANERREFEILPAGEMRRKYGHYAENHPPIHIDPAKAPPDLRDLIRLVERFGVACNITHHDRSPRSRVELNAGALGVEDRVDWCLQWSRNDLVGCRFDDHRP